MKHSSEARDSSLAAAPGARRRHWTAGIGGAWRRLRRALTARPRNVAGRSPVRHAGAWWPARMAWFVPARERSGGTSRGDVHLHARLAFSVRRAGAGNAWFPRTTRVLIAAPSRARSASGTGSGRPVAAPVSTTALHPDAHGRASPQSWTPVPRVVASSGSGVDGASRGQERTDPAAASGSAAKPRPSGLATPADVEAPLSDWEVRRLADRVLETMDRRLVAYRERRGRS